MNLVTRINIKELPEHISRADLSRILGVSLATVDNWRKAGKLSAGHRSIANRYWAKAEIVALLRKLGLC